MNRCLSRFIAFIGNLTLRLDFFRFTFPLNDCKDHEYFLENVVIETRQGFLNRLYKFQVIKNSELVKNLLPTFVSLCRNNRYLKHAFKTCDDVYERYLFVLVVRYFNVDILA